VITRADACSLFIGFLDTGLSYRRHVKPGSGRGALRVALLGSALATVAVAARRRAGRSAGPAQQRGGVEPDPALGSPADAEQSEPDVSANPLERLRGSAARERGKVENPRRRVEIIGQEKALDGDEEGFGHPVA
jgi:hypothetical protein